MQNKTFFQKFLYFVVVENKGIYNLLSKHMIAVISCQDNCIEMKLLRQDNKAVG